MSRSKLFVIALTLLAVGGLGIFMVPKGSTAQPELTGTTLRGMQAPDFRLTDQWGRAVTLRQFRGRLALLTFMNAHCRELCPIVAEKMRRAVDGLGRSGRAIAIMAVSTDPEGDTVAAVRRFSQQHGMLYRWHYLTGTRKQLAAVWRHYYIYAPPKSAPPALRDAHTSATYLIDGAGRERVLFASDLNTVALAQDLRILSGLPVQAAGDAAVSAPEAGYTAPDFVLPGTKGSNLALSSLRGKVVLLNFWASYCIPCRTEMPMLARWYRRLRSQGFLVLGVDKEESPGDVRAFLQKLRIPYPVVLDENGSVTARYNVVGIPTSFLLDRQGIVRSVRIGVVDHSFYVTCLAPLRRGDN